MNKTCRNIGQNNNVSKNFDWDKRITMVDTDELKKEDDITNNKKR